MDRLLRTAGRALSQGLGPLLDATVLLSFDRTGYRVHSWGFEPADLEVDLRGRVALVTGANGGIGRAVAQGLAERGATLALLCRDAGRGEQAADQIRASTGNPQVRAFTVDVSERKSLRDFASAFPEERVDILIHNAGVLPAERAETSEGLELGFATNVLGPFLLTALLREKLAKAAPSRVIWVSSGGMYARKLRIDDLQWQRRRYDGVAAYAETKRAEVILAEMWAERLAERGVKVHSMHPGWADTQGVRTSLPGFHRVMKSLLRTAEQGADTILWLACATPGERTSGLFWFDRAPRSTHWLRSTRESDAERQQLWELCAELAVEEME